MAKNGAQRGAVRGAVPEEMQTLARAVLTLTAAGQAVPLLLVEALADAVLESDLVRLAQAIKAGGDHQLDRALELAERLLEGAAAPDARSVG